MRKLLTVAAAAAAALSASAQAVVIDLLANPVNSRGTTEVATLLDDQGRDVKIIIAPYTESDGSFSSTFGLTAYSGGLGINRDTWFHNDQHTVDGSGPDEAIVFQAQYTDGSLATVNWQSVLFGYVGNSTTDFTAWSGTAGLSSLSVKLDDIHVQVNQPHLLGLLGATLAIQADGSDDFFKLRKIGVDTVPSVDNQVPVPGALPLMLAGLGGLAAVRRRKG